MYRVGVVRAVAGQSSVAEIALAQRWTRVIGVVALLGCALAFGALLATGMIAIMPVAILALCLGAVAFGALWRNPVLGLYTALFAALFIEQFGIAGLDPLTAQTHYFETLSGFSPVPVPLSAADLTLYLTLAAILLPALGRGGPAFEKGPLFGQAMFFLGTVLFSVVYGASRGAFNQKAAIAEARAFTYLVICYLLATNLLTTRKRLYAFVWCIILGSGLKGVQGINNYLTEKRLGVALEAITSHEDVLFFAAFLMLLATMVLYQGHGRQLRVMLYLLLPLVFTLLATKRRIGFIVLAIGLLIAGLSLLKGRRALLFKFGPLAVGLVIVYFIVFWNAQGALGQPVRAFRSQLGQGSERDRASNLWREAEKVNIAFNIKQSPILGLGFGQPYSFVVFQGNLDETGFVYWRYITHNAIFWVWMKMGLIGFIAFWYLLGSGIVLGMIVFRRLTDRYLQALALLGAGMIAMQIFFSYGDLGLTYSRNMIYVGCLLGMIVKLPALEGLPEPIGRGIVRVVRMPVRVGWFAQRMEAETR